MSANPLDDLKTAATIAGLYEATLTAVRFERRPKYQEEQTLEPTLCFDFYVDEEDADVTKYATVKTGKRSNLTKLLSGMAPDTFNPRTTFADKDALWEFVQRFVNRRFDIVCEIAGEGGTYTKITTVTPKRVAKKGKAAAAPATGEQEGLALDDPRPKKAPAIGDAVSFEDDDIPF